MAKEDAIEAAAQKGGYVIWGLVPFLRTQQQYSVDLQPLVLGDPLLQRIMVSIAVNPDKIPGVNTEGVTAFQQVPAGPDHASPDSGLPLTRDRPTDLVAENNAGYVLPKL